jgi:hypothetical protein
MVSKMTSPLANSQLKELTSALGQPVVEGVSPTVIVVSSVAGGSGAGMFMDVAEATKAAIGPKPWVHQIFSLLFAPDVFEELGDAKMRAMAPNALGAVAELVSGFWRGAPTEATLAIYSRYGITVPGDTLYSLGPNFNYIIGRRNGNAKPVDFGSQQGVYLAASQSLAAWMTDTNVQDSLSAYAVTNFQTKSAGMADATGLKRARLDGQPLSSIGFGRVSLGLDKFSEYAAERMAKQTLETILKQHIAEDPDLKQMKEDQWIQHHADVQEGAFVGQSGLDELTESNNQVVDAIWPDLTEVLARLQADISYQVSQGTPKEGHSFEAWVSRITHAYEVSVPPRISDAEGLIAAKAREWVQATPSQLLELVRKTIAQQGLPVTIELLNRLIEQSKRAVAELLGERGRHLADSAHTSILVSEKLAPAQQMPKIVASHPTVAEAMLVANTSFGWIAYAEAKRTASELLADFTKNYLEPLKLQLSRTYGALNAATADPKLPDSRQNPYATWPNFKSKSVDERFKPAPNEQMLIDHKTFPKLFDELIKQTVNDPQVQESRKVIDEMLGGSRLLQGVAELDDSYHWTILDLADNQMWVPAEAKFRLRDQASQPAKFEFEVNHMNYIDFAKRWSRVPGRAFASYLNQSLVSYLGASGDTQEKSKRMSDFVSAVGAAIQSADPLVSLDATLLALTHESVGKTAICSGIPVDETDPAYEAITNVLVSNGYDDTHKWFTSSGAGANLKSIEIFTQMETSVNPLVMSSLMGTIASEWMVASSDYASRSNFMNWRRGRELTEAIPAHQERWSLMLSGWHVARLLNLFENDTKHPSYADKGPKVSIWVDPAKQWRGFPYPLYSSQIAKNVEDYPAIILESLIIALGECNLQQSLAPLDPYQKLMQLGGGDSNNWADLENWILNGSVPQGAPMPRAERAGLPTDSPQQRKEVSLAYVTDMMEGFRGRMAALDPHVDPRSYPIVWEIRRELEASYESVLAAIRNVEIPGDL